MCSLDLLQARRAHAGSDGGQRSPQLVGPPVAAAKDEAPEAVSSRSGGDLSRRTEPWPERPRPGPPGRRVWENRMDSDFSPRRGPLPWLFF